MNHPRTGEICARHFATRQIVRVCWENGIITSIEPAASSGFLPRPATKEWGEGEFTAAASKEEVWIAPALVDVQVNGYGGVDFQRDGLTVENLLSAARQLRAAGCGRFLLTLITDEWPKLTARLKHLRSLREQSDELKNAIAGWHIEGPFLSHEPGYHGAHNPALMIDPTPAHISELRKLTGDDPLLMTLSPERRGAIEVIQLAVSRGMIVSLGHTNASAEILCAAVKAGATGFTHLANGCPRELARDDNILWRVFETPGLTVGLIPDRIHVSPTLFRLIHRVQKPDSIYYTTDAMSAAGAPPGKYSLGEMEMHVGADLIVRQPGKTNLAGSALRPIDGIFRAAQMLDCPWQEVWPRFSETPAKLMGLRGGLAVGEQADFCLLKVGAENQPEIFQPPLRAV